MNISPAAIAAVRSHVTNWTPSNATILAALNATTIDNPESQQAVPVEMHETHLAGLLIDPTNGSLAKLLLYVNFASVKADVERQNNSGVAAWAYKLAFIGIFTEGEADAVAAYAMTPVPDPSYRPQISWAESVLGRLLDLDDIAASRPGA